MSTTSTAATDSQTILIIDDTPINLRVAVEYLESNGFRVAIARDGLEGLKRAELVQPDLILLDVMMPGVDGLETCRRLKACPTTWDIPVIFMTSLSGSEDKVAGFRAGAVDYVGKPLQIDELIARVTTHLGLYAERKRAQAMLHKREQEFRALVENSPDFIARVDGDCRYLYINPALERLLGASLSEVQGKTKAEVAQRSGVREAPATEELARAVARTGISTEGQFLIHAADSEGEPDVWHQIRFVPERDRDGKVASVLLLGRDISAIKEAERRLEESHAQLRHLTKRRETAREEERKRIAREIHDELGQHLTALRMGVSMLRLQFGQDNPALVERVGALMALADQAIQVVRNVASSLRPGVLNMGLASALEWLVDEFSRHTNIACLLDLPDEKIDIDDERATAMFRLVQESLTNVARHAKPNRVNVVVERHDDGYRLAVSDDGLGFDPAVRRKNAFGLVGMRERALMLGGEMRITSSPGHGTTISVDIPASFPTEAE